MSQASQVPSQAASQQTPSVQRPLSHSVPAAQGSPSDRSGPPPVPPVPVVVVAPPALEVVVVVVAPPLLSTPPAPPLPGGAFSPQVSVFVQSLPQPVVRVPARAPSAATASPRIL